MRIRPAAGTMIAKLGLTPHPGGGQARETWRVAPDEGTRPAGTAMLYLLAAGERSAWHRVDAAELWLFQGGDPLELSIAGDEGARPVPHILGTEVVDGEQPQVIVPTRALRSARTLGSWTLVTRIVSPGSWSEGFELAPSDREPGDPSP